MHLGLHLARFQDQLLKECVSLLQLKLRLVFNDLYLPLSLLITLIWLLHVLVSPSKPLLVLVHAQRQTIFKRLLFSKDRAVVDLLYSFPLLTQLRLDLGAVRLRSGYSLSHLLLYGLESEKLRTFQCHSYASRSHPRLFASFAFQNSSAVASPLSNEPLPSLSCTKCWS